MFCILIVWYNIIDKIMNLFFELQWVIRDFISSRLLFDIQTIELDFLFNYDVMKLIFYNFQLLIKNSIDFSLNCVTVAFNLINWIISLWLNFRTSNHEENDVINLHFYLNMSEKLNYIYYCMSVYVCLCIMFICLL